MLRISWRNWGSQIRVIPQQNIHSAAVLASTRTALRRLVTPIVSWYRTLDPADRWLLAGVKVGWEASIGWNAYYWPKGNSYLARYPHDPSHDPCCHLLNLSAPAWGMVPIGYAAAASARLSPSGPGGALSSSDLATLVQWCVEPRVVESSPPRSAQTASPAELPLVPPPSRPSVGAGTSQI